MDININITKTEGRPIYEQIMFQIEQLIIMGKLKEGDMLPSMRFLANELKISLITTKRAYEELEREGFITTMSGKGCFIAKGSYLKAKNGCLQKIKEDIEKIVENAKLCGLSNKELTQILKDINKENE